MELNFDERFRKLTPQQALLEASRCLLCEDAPCAQACPAGVDVMRFIRAIRFNNDRRALRIIRDSNVFAGVCGTICPRERLCEEACSNTKLSHHIHIGQLQRYAADAAGRHKGIPSEPVTFGPRKVAVVGGGPAGLSVAANLNRKGIACTVFELRARAGGVAYFAAPPFRLAGYVVSQDVEPLAKMGVEIRVRQEVADIDDLFAQGFDAVFLGTGLMAGVGLPLPGADAEGVYIGLDFLEEVCLDREAVKGSGKVGRRVVVIGGGSVAMDVAASARRLGADSVELVALEGAHELPATREDRDEAMSIGISLLTRAQVTEILTKDGKVTCLAVSLILWCSH